MVILRAEALTFGYYSRFFFDRRSSVDLLFGVRHSTIIKFN